MEWQRPGCLCESPAPLLSPFAIVVFFGCGDRRNIEKPLQSDHVRICLYALKAPQSVDRCTARTGGTSHKVCAKGPGFRDLGRHGNNLCLCRTSEDRPCRDG